MWNRTSKQIRLQFIFETIVTVTPYLRGRLRFLLVLGFVTQGISLQVSKCLAEQIKPWFFSFFLLEEFKVAQAHPFYFAKLVIWFQCHLKNLQRIEFVVSFGQSNLWFSLKTDLQCYQKKYFLNEKNLMRSQNTLDECSNQTFSSQTCKYHDYDWSMVIFEDHLVTFIYRLTSFNVNSQIKP